MREGGAAGGEDDDDNDDDKDIDKDLEGPANAAACPTDEGPLFCFAAAPHAEHVRTAAPLTLQESHTHLEHVLQWWRLRMIVKRALHSSQAGKLLQLLRAPLLGDDEEEEEDEEDEEGATPSSSSSLCAEPRRR